MCVCGDHICVVIEVSINNKAKTAVDFHFNCLGEGHLRSHDPVGGAEQVYVVDEVKVRCS